MSLKGATFDHTWGGVRRKIFANAGAVADETPLFALKVSPIAHDLLVES